MSENENIQGRDMAIVFFGELGTKGKNIFDFIRLLGRNIKDKLSGFPQLTYEVHKDHIYIGLNGVAYEDIVQGLAEVPGIHAYAKVKAVDKTLEGISAEAVRLGRETQAHTFKVVCKRADKNFPIHSDEICREVGAAVLQNCPNLKVDVHNPELEIHVYIRKEGAFVYGPKDPGMGGYPLGIAGKALQLLSGGIDSPVSAYLMMKRGCKVDCIHFAAPPYTSDKVLDKLDDLLTVLNKYQHKIKLYVVPFTKVQEKIYDVAGTSYAITIMRRMMLRIAQNIGKRNKDLVLSSGESIGQVASQTLRSMNTIDSVLKTTLIRPLACYDKTEIIDIAKKIGTYDISIRPYEDCCTIFEVKDPSTAPRIDKCEAIEAKFDFKPLLDEAIKNTKAIWISRDEERPEGISGLLNQMQDKQAKE